MDSATLAVEPAAPVRSDFNFAGWYKDSVGTEAWIFSSDLVISDITLYAKWTERTVRQFTVAFDSRDGSSVNSQLIDSGAHIAEPTPPAREGFTFAGWYSDSNGINAWVFTSDIVISDTVFYAKWTDNQFSVLFDSKGGSPVDAQLVDSGAFAKDPGIPTKTGHTFKSWQKDTTSGVPWSFETNQIVSNTTLYASWAPVSHTVTFDDQNATVSASPSTIDVTYPATTVVSLPAEPEKANYDFQGWWTAANGEGTQFDTLTKVDSSITVYAKWAPVSFVVTFNGQGSSAPISPATISVTYPATILDSLPGDPSKDNFTFGGWWTAPNGGGTQFTSTTQVTSSIEVHAHWIPVSHTITFDGQNATIAPNPSSMTVTYPDTTIAALPTEPTRNNYTFGGWWTSIGGGGSQFTTSTMVTSSMTVYAKWNPVSYVVTFDPQGATTGPNPSSATVTYPATTVESLPTEPSRNYYNFGGWWTSPNGAGTQFTASTIVTSSVTVYAKWTPVSFTVTFDGQGATSGPSPSTKTVTYPATTIDALPTAPAKTGKHFGGWWTAPQGGGSKFLASTNVNQSITVYAFWGDMKDYDGNVYTAVTIGTQVWLAQNLRVTHLNDGMLIPNVVDSATWANSTIPALCWDGFDSASYSIPYGALYNWYAVATGKLAPSGWHVATNAEWDVLINYLGGATVAPPKLMEAGGEHWQNNAAATNSSGFTALPAGYKHPGSKNPPSVGTTCYIWTADEFDILKAYYQYMCNNCAKTIYRFSTSKASGLSVRLIKD